MRAVRTRRSSTHTLRLRMSEQCRFSALALNALILIKSIGDSRTFFQLPIMTAYGNVAAGRLPMRRRSAGWIGRDCSNIYLRHNRAVVLLYRIDNFCEVTGMVKTREELPLADTEDEGFLMLPWGRSLIDQFLAIPSLYTHHPDQKMMSIEQSHRSFRISSTRPVSTSEASGLCYARAFKSSDSLPTHQNTYS
jgi:hypothetical protein